jgi:pimeloyl-ACP methyl ester carboxylesterase
LDAEEAVTVVFVHGFPETRGIWTPLRGILGRPSVALALPGFGAPRPRGFAATKDAYADWLEGELAALEGPVDLVAHDVGALLAMRLVSARDVAVRSWVVDVPDIFHPRAAWPERVRRMQQPGVGEEVLRAAREAAPEDPGSTRSRLAAAGVPPALACGLAAAHDEVMSGCMLAFYRSAVPNVAATWWDGLRAPARGRGLVLLLPDPPEIRSMATEVAARLGARTEDLGDLDHCWMAQAPEKVAPVLDRFWDSVEAER